VVEKFRIFNIKVLSIEEPGIEMEKAKNRLIQKEVPQPLY